MNTNRSARSTRLGAAHGARANRPARAGIIAAAAVLACAASGSSALGAKIELLAIGDGLTAGDGVVGGYRTELYHDLTKAGYSVTWDGSATVNLTTAYAGDHDEGHSGYLIDQIAGNLLGNDGSTGNDGGFWLGVKVQPNVILLNVGAADFTQNHDVLHAVDRLNDLITELTAARPKAQVIVSDLIPRADSAATEALQQTYYNAYLPQIVHQHQQLGEHVTFLDLHSVVSDAVLVNGINPNQAGYNKVGDAWFGAVSAVDPVGSTIPEPSLAGALGAFGAAALGRRRRTA